MQVFTPALYFEKVLGWGWFVVGFDWLVVFWCGFCCFFKCLNSLNTSSQPCHEVDALYQLLKETNNKHVDLEQHEAPTKLVIQLLNTSSSNDVQVPNGKIM